MTTYVSNCGSDFGEMICVNKWDTEDDVVSYDYESGFGGGMTYHDSIDVASGELNWDQPSPQFSTCRGMNFNREPIIFSDLEHWSDANCDDSSDRNCYDDFDGNCDYQYGYSISEISGMRHDESCSMKYDTAWNESNAYTDYEVASLGNDVKHEVDTNGYGRYAEFNHVDASRTPCPSYAPSTYLTHTHMKPHQFSGHHPTSYSLHKQPQRSLRPTPYVPPHLRQYPTQSQALPSYHKPSYMRPHHNSPPMSPHTAHNSIPSHLTHVSSSRRHYRTHTYDTTASAYTPPPYERFVPQTVIEEVPLSSSLEAQRKKYLGVNIAGDGTCEIDEVCNDDRTYFGNFHVPQPMVLHEHRPAGLIHDFVTLEFLVEQNPNISKRLCYVAEESQQLGEKHQHHLRSKMKEETFLSLVEQEELTDAATVMGLNELEGAAIKLAISLPCLEGKQLIDDSGFVSYQELTEDKSSLLVESIQENEKKAEQWIGLENVESHSSKFANNVIEIPSLMVEEDQYEISNLGLVIEEDELFTIEQRKALDVWHNHALLTGSQIPVGPTISYAIFSDPFLAEFAQVNRGQHGGSNLHLAAWTEALREKKAGTILYAWFGNWRPPDVVHQHLGFGSDMAGARQVAYFSPWVATILIAWGTVWRPPDTRVTVYDCLYHLLVWTGFWFSCWRPPDGVGALGFSFCPPCSFEVEAFQSRMD